MSENYTKISSSKGCLMYYFQKAHHASVFLNLWQWSLNKPSTFSDCWAHRIANQRKSGFAIITWNNLNKKWVETRKNHQGFLATWQSLDFIHGNGWCLWWTPGNQWSHFGCCKLASTIGRSPCKNDQGCLVPNSDPINTNKLYHNHIVPVAILWNLCLKKSGRSWSISIGAGGFSSYSHIRVIFQHPSDSLSREVEQLSGWLKVDGPWTKSMWTKKNTRLSSFQLINDKHSMYIYNKICMSTCHVHAYSISFMYSNKNHSVKLRVCRGLHLSPTPPNKPAPSSCGSERSDPQCWSMVIRESVSPENKNVTLNHLEVGVCVCVHFFLESNTYRKQK